MPRRLVTLFACLALTGCSAIASIQQAAEPLDAYELRAPAALPQARAPGRAQVTVERPATGGAIDTDRILIRQPGAQIAYLPGVRWSAPAPEMVQSATIETLLRTGAFGFAGARPLGASGDLVLVTNLLDFGAGVAAPGDGATVAVRLDARLVDEIDGRILAGRSFAQAVAVPDTSTGAVVAGFQAATDAVLADLARWAIAAAP
jgi:cholesterol transport system auxiliary component